MSVRNWSGSVSFEPTEVATPDTEAEVAEVLRRAAARGIRVRAIGSGHSFTPVAATEGVLLRLDHLSGLVAADPDTGEVTLWGGTRIRDIARLLAPWGLALANMGDIDAQSIAGAVSTGTHGTGLGLTGYSGMVTGLRLALPDGSLVDTSRTVRPDLFEAARVGLGAMGIITQVRIGCVPQFNLEAHETTEPIAQVLEEFVERSREVDHLEFFWFPGTPRATVKQNRRMGPKERIKPMRGVNRVISHELLGNTVFGAVDHLASWVPRVAPLVREVGSRFMAGGRHSDASHEVFVTPRRVRFQESEYAVPLEAFPEVVREVERAIVASGEQVTFPMEIRTAAADDTWLGTASGRESVYVAVHRYHREDFAPILRTVEPIFAAQDGRPHWGKQHTLGAEELAVLYPRFGDAQRVRAEVDPDGVLVNEHVSRIFGLPH